MYSVELYRRLQQSEHPVGWAESGGIKLASVAERLEEIRRQISWARTYDLPLHEISAGRGGRAVPADRHRRRRRRGLPRVRRLPRPVAAVLLAGAPARGRAGVRDPPHTRVLGIDVSKRPGSTGVRTDRGDIDCEVVVNCGGMFAAEIGRLAGVRIPVVPMSHQYVVTEPFLPRREHAAADAARSRPARLLPPGGRRPADGRLRARPGAVDGVATTPSTRSPPTSTASCSPEDWPRFEEIAAQRAAPGAGDGRRRRAHDDQRPGGVHAGQRVLPRRDRGGRVLRRGRASARTASPAPAASAR